MNPAAGLDALDALDDLTAQTVAELATLRAALAQLRRNRTAAPFMARCTEAAADQSVHRLCRAAVGIAIHAAGLAAAAGVRFHVGRDLPRLDPSASLPGLSLPVALAALLDARAAGATDAELFTSLMSDEGDA